MRQASYGIRIVVVTLGIVSTAWGQSAESKTAEQIYKNITQLKSTPADQLGPAMQFIAVSLGVECNFCHVQGKMEADDKPAKKIARQMMAMMAAINKDSFSGRQEVTCYSCHHGSAHPAGTPPVQDSDAPARPEAHPAIPTAGSTPAVEIIDKYVAALGGSDAIHNVTSRVMKGAILVGGTETPIDLVTKAPNKRISITHMGNRESITAFDGTSGWLGSTGRPPRVMSASESWAAGLDAEFYLATRIQEIFPQLRVGRPETIAGTDCNVVIGVSPGTPPVRLYFDKGTGLLVRLVRYAETPLGRMPTQIDYADYRDAGGAKIPYRWTLSRPNGRFTIQVAEVKANVPIDDQKFAKPADEVK